MYKTIGLLLAIICFSNADWRRMCGSSTNPVPPHVRVTKSDSSSVRIAAIVFGFASTDTLIDGKTFQRVTIPGEEVDHDTMHAGLPQIPYITLKIAVPDSCDFNISVECAENNVLNNFLIYPVPRIVFDDSGGLIRGRDVYTYDTSFYEKDTLYPNKTYDIVNIGHWRDQRVIEIALYPVQFDPNDQVISCASRMELKIQYVGQVSFDSSSLGPYEGLARDILLNYRGIDRQPPPHPSPSVHYYTNLLDASNVADYIIVTSGAFLLNETTFPKINEFAQWRVDHNGFDVAVVSMQDIINQFEPQGHDSIQLRNFLVYAYNNWHAYSMPDDHYAFCLFIGDWDYVPTALYRYFDNDLREWLGADEFYFTNLDQDPCSTPDIMLGRWPVKVGKWQDLFTIADKTINYEQNPSLGDWRRDVFLTAGDKGDGSGFNVIINYCYPYVLAIGYDTISVTKYIDDQHSLTDEEYRDSVQKYLNAGNLLTTYVDHGDPKGWDSYDTTQIKTLANGAQLPVIISNACLTAMFQWDNPFYGPEHFRPHSDSSFGELMLVHPNGGAVAFWGATIYSVILEQKWCRNMFTYQNWILGYSANAGPYGYCLLGDPALDLGDYSAYPTLPDLIIRPVDDDFKLLDPYPYPATNATIPIRAKVMNIGHVSASNVPVKFCVKLQGVSIYTNTVTVGPILPRDSAIATVNWNTALTNPNYVGLLGDCNIECTVDPNNTIQESWELNNYRSITRKIVFYPYLAGWPKKVSQYSQPALGDINRMSSEIEIAYTSLDSVYVFRPNGTICGNWPKYFKNVKGLTLADLDNNGNLEIIAYSAESLKVYDYNGNVLPGWPVAMPLFGYDYYGLPSLGHIDGAGTWSIIMIARQKAGSTNNSMHILVYSTTGMCAHDFAVSYGIGRSYRIISLAIDDVLNTGSDYDEICISYIKMDDTPEQRTVYDYVEIFNNGGLARTLDYGGLETVGLYDVNSNGYADLIIGDYDGYIKAYDAQNNALIWNQAADLGYPTRSSLVIGDVHPIIPGVEINFGNDLSKIHLRRGVNGDNISPWADTTTGVSVTSSAIAHIDGDNNLDIITATDGFYLYAHDYNKYRIAPYPMPFFSSLSSPVLGDLNGDRRNETVVASADGYLHILKNANSRVTQNSVEWPQFHHDYQHTGVFGGP